MKTPSTVAELVEQLCEVGSMAVNQGLVLASGGNLSARLPGSDQYVVLLSALGHDIRLITLDHAYYVKSIGTTPYYPNGSDELADTAAEQCREHNCVVLANHGCVALGPDIGMAYRRALNLEEAAIATYRALALGDTMTAFPPDSYAELHHV